MSQAAKCDRCGGFFDPEGDFEGERCRFVNPVFKNSEDSKTGRVTYFLMKNQPPDKMLDLCPACAFDFIRFMNKSQLEKALDYDTTNKVAPEKPFRFKSAGDIFSEEIINKNLERLKELLNKKEDK